MFFVIQSSTLDHIEKISLAESKHPELAAMIVNIDDPLPIVHRIVRPVRNFIITSKPATPTLEYLRDLKTIWVLFWLSTLLLSFAILTLLLKRMNGPFYQVREAVNNMASGDLLQPIQIEGSDVINELSNALEQMRYRLSEGSKNQSQFLRHISHEIKTPLTSIKEGSRLLSDEILGPISSEQREITDILNKSTLELQASIENLLNYNSAVSVEKVKHRQNVDIGTLVELAKNRQTLALKAKDINLSIQTEEVMGFVDPAQITTVFENLLSNAVKFSPPEGLITIQLYRLEKIIHFSIQDDGPGIDKKQKEAVFSAFYVGKQATRGPLKGTGLGLSIVKQYIELHSGKASLIERPDRKQTGACFLVTFEC